MCVCVRERERERESVCVRERERECECECKSECMYSLRQVSLQKQQKQVNYRCTDVTICCRTDFDFDSWQYDPAQVGGGLLMAGSCHWIRPLRMWLVKRFTN